MADLWNVNIHYDARLAACVPATARSVLDVGCGDGFLAARLVGQVPLVVAIDVDARCWAGPGPGSRTRR
jgi:methylase of polypeptide subunit release factors